MDIDPGLSLTSLETGLSLWWRDKLQMYEFLSFSFIIFFPLSIDSLSRFWEH